MEWMVSTCGGSTLSFMHILGQTGGSLYYYWRFTIRLCLESRQELSSITSYLGSLPRSYCINLCIVLPRL